MCKELSLSLSQEFATNQPLMNWNIWIWVNNLTFLFSYLQQENQVSELEKKHQKERDEIKSNMTKELNEISAYSENQQKEEITKVTEQAKTKYQELKHKVCVVTFRMRFVLIVLKF